MVFFTEKNYNSFSISIFQVNSYGYAYGSSRSRGNQYQRKQNEADDDTQLKKLIREIRISLNDTREFWSKLPYSLCKEDEFEASKLRGGYGRSRYDRQFFKVKIWLQKSRQCIHGV